MIGRLVMVIILDFGMINGLGIVPFKSDFGACLKYVISESVWCPRFGMEIISGSLLEDV